MRTTVNIDEALLQQAKELAVRSSRSLGEVLDDALRMLLAEASPADAEDFSLPTYGGSGLRPGVDLTDKDALAELLDDSESSRAAG